MLRSHNLVGATSEMMVAAYLLSCGYEVFGPLSPHTKADLVYVDASRAIRVQVKTATLHSTSVSTFEQCRLTIQKNKFRYTKNEVDEFWIVGTHLWKFPIELLEGREIISLGSDTNRPRKTVRDYDPDDYIVIRGSKNLRFRDRLVFNDPDFRPSVTKTDYSPKTLYSLRHKPGGDLYEKRMLKQAAGAPPRKPRTKKVSHEHP
jgi:hypothetical protein